MNGVVERINIAYQYLLKVRLVSNKKDLAIKMDYNYTNIISAFKGSKKYLTSSFIKEFNKAFGGIFNEEWLLKGEGDMLKEGITSNYSYSSPSVSQVGMGNSSVQFGGGNNGKVIVSASECQGKLNDALLEIKHLKERLKDKDEMIEILKSQLNK